MLHKAKNFKAVRLPHNSLDTPASQVNLYFWNHGLDMVAFSE